MATDKKISDLTLNPSIDGSEDIPTEKGGSNFKNTYTGLKTWLQGVLNFGVTNAANGLNKNNGVVELGGEANKDTTVDGTGVKVIQSGDDSIESFTKLTLGNSESSTDIAELYFEHLNQDDFDTKTEIKIRSALTGAILQYSTMSIINGLLTASVIETDEEKARIFYKDFDTDIEKSLIFGKNTTGLEVKDESGKGFFYTGSSDTVNLGAWGTEPLSVPREQRIIDNQKKTVEDFPTEETTAFTVADDSDRAWIDCNFTVETEVTITSTSVSVIGEPVYFSVKGVGQIKFVESGVTIDLNTEQTLILGSLGDKIALMKTGSLTYEVV